MQAVQFVHGKACCFRGAEDFLMVGLVSAAQCCFGFPAVLKWGVGSLPNASSDKT